jgi:hypothetical protein
MPIILVAVVTSITGGKGCSLYDENDFHVHNKSEQGAILVS